ncbi:MAG: HD domain-containing protein [bacterium]|nr:HD domain-containing protein [bacterium]
MRIKSKLILENILITIFICSIISFFIIRHTIEIKNSIDKITMSNLQELEAVMEISYNIQRIKSNIRELIIESVDGGNIEEVQHAISAIKNNSLAIQNHMILWEKAIKIGSQLEPESIEEKFEIKKFNNFKPKLSNFIELSKKIIRILDEKGNKACSEFFENKLEPQSRLVQNEAGGLKELIKSEITAATIKTNALITDTFIYSCIAIIAAFFSAVVIGFFMMKSFSSNIIKLRNAVVEIGDGKLDTRINIKSNDEIEDLAVSFNNMANDLKIAMKKEKELAALAVELKKDNEKSEEFKTIYEILKVSNKKTEDAHKHAIYMLAIASDNKDHGTGEHINRIKEMTIKLALKLGIAPKLVEKMGTDSILHDLGKIAIPDNILLKTGKLTDEESEIMKLHTVKGANIIGDDKWFIQARQIALYHHEKWDGSGYPEGLKGKAIPLAARIVAIVDVFDALTSRRPYKESWTCEKAIEKIKINSGTHFDPKIVEAFLSLYSK